MLFARDTPEDETVVALLASALRRDISFGVLRPDEKLKLDALRKRYGGSNHSMRETLRTLVAEGMVEATNQRGFRVTSATEADLQDILLVQIEVGKLGLARSLERGGVSWEASVIAAQHQLAHADQQVQDNPDDITALQWDEASRLHADALISACDSPRLLSMSRVIYNQSRRFRLACLREGRFNFSERAERRDALRSAIVARDERAALALFEESTRADMT
ncbi:MAG: GntR family transcriptional regulator [Pseudomonadota bacterium]